MKKRKSPNQGRLRGSFMGFCLRSRQRDTRRSRLRKRYAGAVCGSTKTSWRAARGGRVRLALRATARSPRVIAPVLWLTGLISYHSGDSRYWDGMRMTQGSQQDGFRVHERDRLAAELRYVTCRYNWDPSPEIVAAIIDWHIAAVEAARNDMWVPGMAGSRDPLVEEVLSRYYAHHLGAATAKLIEENTALKQRFVEVLACIRFYALAGSDGGASAKTTLERVIAHGIKSTRAGVIPVARPHQVT